MRGVSCAVVVAAVLQGAACARPTSITPSPDAAIAVPIEDGTARADYTSVRSTQPAVPPQLAMLAGLLPLRSTGADLFRVTHQTYDGRGVLIAILDSGIDPTLPGMQRTTTGARKLVDLRDFSDEGLVQLEVVKPRDGTVVIGGRELSGFGRVRALSTGPFYGGMFREITLGSAPAGDLNGDGTLDGAFAVVVARASDGWVAVIDRDGDGSLLGERPIRDYGVAQESFTFSANGDGPMGVAVNLMDEDGVPSIRLVMDNSSHGSHVAGIAAGHDLFGVEGFDGVAPGAQVLGLKIADNTRGGISVTGSMMAAMNYAAEYAAARSAPLVINLSYGIGNAVEGTAVIDSLVNAFALEHPEVLVVISAGNDGPGLSTIGLPGSAAQALTVCALFPGVFADPPQAGQPPRDDVLGWWSARGGEVAKPDVCAPGVAYSNVPRWRTGEEVSGGTSMAAPQIAGAAALLLSGLLDRGIDARAVDLRRAMVTTARPLAGTTVLDGGTGVAHVPSAFEWLQAAHQTGIYDIRAVVMGGNHSGGSAAVRRRGLASAGDTIQVFEVQSIGGQPAARLTLGADVPWISGPATIEPGGGPVTVQLTYDAAAFREPGMYVGTVWARPATDQLGGASFGLTNTVIVPYALDRPARWSGMLTPGAVARYFVDVPADADGLTVVLTLTDSTRDATLYLFEPDGAPHRGGSSAHTSGRGRAALHVALDDLKPGVYEAVIVAPPAMSVAYRLRAAVPALRATVNGTPPVLSVRSSADTGIAGQAVAQVVGTRHETHVRASTPGAQVVEVVVPKDAATLVLQVALAPELWRRLTDFGVTVFDVTGRKLSDGPLHYPVGRQSVAVETYRPGDLLRIELQPAFADGAGEHRWDAMVRADFLSTEPVSLGSTGADFELAPGAVSDISFAWPPDSIWQPGPLGDLVEFRVELDDGSVVATRAITGQE
jgi:subtilisin family serine protease